MLIVQCKQCKYFSEDKVYKGEGKYIMIVEEGKGYDTVLEMFFLEEDIMIRSIYGII